ncbi:MAG TPA: hypothetical protein VM598_06285, partial [Bdellovibrionota bacterium]|nr:hypothetical protein [Bdellovibrionota bacterium]
DDFTRDVVAEWMGCKLEFHPPSWDHINERLGRFGIKVAESNRQQCFFPPKSEVIANAEGTANAFACEHDGRFVWVLPGPPREIEVVWRAGVETRLRTLIGEKLPALAPAKLLLWSCMGKSEAELGEIVEHAVAGSGLLTGYRAHRPFVEVKLWVPEKDLERHRATVDRLETALKPWAVARGGEDLGIRMIERLSFADEIELYDSATGGYLAERMGSLLRRPGFERQAAALDFHCSWVSPASPAEWVSGILAQCEPETVCLAVAGFVPGTGEWAIGLKHGSIFKQETLKSPFKVPELLERAQRYAVELTFKRASEWLDEAFH